MKLSPYPLFRPLLFCLPAEAAHDLGLAALAHGQQTPLRCLWSQPRISDPIELAGLRFPNRVGLAAGLDKNARAIDAFAAMGFGFIEVGTVTPLGQAGNPRPRMFRLAGAGAIINRMGFNNEGLDAFVRHVQSARLSSLPTGKRPLLGLNIGKNKDTPMERAQDDYLRCLEGVYPHADYVTVNISSPNTANLRDLQQDAMLGALLSVLVARREELAREHGKRVPLFVKIAPDLADEQIPGIATVLRDQGVDGVIATNTTVARDAVATLPHGQEAGGLSGTPLLTRSNAVIAQLRQALGPDFPIVGVGGIASAADALAKLQAGASVVQFFTGLIYRGPALVHDVARALRDQRAGR